MSRFLRLSDISSCSVHDRLGLADGGEKGLALVADDDVFCITHRAEMACCLLTQSGVPLKDSRRTLIRTPVVLCREGIRGTGPH